MEDEQHHHQRERGNEIEVIAPLDALSDTQEQVQRPLEDHQRAHDEADGERGVVASNQAHGCHRELQVAGQPKRRISR